MIKIIILILAMMISRADLNQIKHKLSKLIRLKKIQFKFKLELNDSPLKQFKFALILKRVKLEFDYNIESCSS